MKLRTAAIILSAMAFSTGAQAADIEAGMKVFKKCKACHNVDKEKNKVGPHLIGVVDRAAGAVEGYKYSAAMSMASGNWTYENLNRYLARPAEAVPGTKMDYAGIENARMRADVLAFLRTLAATPYPLP